MAGKANRFNPDDTKMVIKPLINVRGEALYQWALRSLPLKLFTYKLIIYQKIHQELEKSLKKETEFSLMPLNGFTKGPGQTLFHALSYLGTAPVVVCDCDVHFKSKDFEQFLQSPDPEVECGVLTFKSNSPSYSYVQQESGRVIEIVEKKVISSDAVCGAYYFHSGNSLKKILQEEMELRGEEEIFMSDLIKNLLKKKRLCRAFPCDKHVSLGTPEEIKQNAFLLLN